MTVTSGGTRSTFRGSLNAPEHKVIFSHADWEYPLGVSHDAGDPTDNAIRGDFNEE